MGVLSPSFLLGCSPLCGASFYGAAGPHATKRCIGKLSNGFDFLGYRVVPGRRLRTSAEGRRRFTEKFRRLYEQGADNRRLWRYAERWCRWRRAGLDGLVSLKGGLRRVVIRQLRMLGIVGFPFESTVCRLLLIQFVQKKRLVQRALRGIRHSI